MVSSITAEIDKAQDYILEMMAIAAHKFEKEWKNKNLHRQAVHRSYVEYLLGLHDLLETRKNFIEFFEEEEE